MASIKNYYFILGISRGASEAEITSAYEGIIESSRSDSGSLVMMGEVKEAYECLIDAARRKEYDTTLGSHTPQQPGGIKPWTSSSGSKLELEHYYQNMKNERRAKIRWRNFITLMVLLLLCGSCAIYGYNRYREQKALKASESEERARMFHVNKPPETPVETEETFQSYVKPKAQPIVRTYSVMSGGVVTAEKATCRNEPYDGAKVTATMRKDTVFFATKELRLFDGTVWYFVENSSAEGWVRGNEVKTYAYSKAN
ncbi:MAG: DnaJ domain-containing protein [Synergistaceae bacterium]|jgi:hypothetical protein|nr:DnaJ domain-containing protein [Synergistaceae bacterium]